MLRYYLIHITIIILRRILYLVYLGPCLGRFMLYFCDPVFIFSLFFIAINHIMSLKRMHLIFAHFLGHFVLLFNDNVDEESK